MLFLGLQQLLNQAVYSYSHSILRKIYACVKAACEVANSAVYLACRRKAEANAVGGVEVE